MRRESSYLELPVKRLIAALSLLVALAMQAEAQHRELDYKGIVGHAGCHAKVVTSDEHSVFESAYDYQNHVLYVGTEPGELPEELAIMVVLHETGHCLQDQEGLLRMPGPRSLAENQALELDADRRSADMACRLGLDGRGLIIRLLEWARDAFDYYGDPGHGTLDQRMSTGRLALSCEKSQAPMLVRQ